jgi:predicted TIM-barrel fold metal-dependent hydrolase
MTDLLVPQVLRRLHTDEFDAVPYDTRLRRIALTAKDRLPDLARRLNVALAPFAFDRRATALSLELLNVAHGERFYELERDAATDEAAAAASFAGRVPVIDVQTHIIDEKLWTGPMVEALSTFNAMVDPDRWSEGLDPRMADAAMWAALVFGSSETAVALLTSTPGKPGENILENGQIAAVRDVVERYAGTGRLLSHTIIHPNLGRDEIDAMPDHVANLRPSAWKVYTMYGPPTKYAPEGGWFLDDAEIGGPFLDMVMRCGGPRIVCSHKGLGGPIPSASVKSTSPRDVGPAAKAFPEINFVIYHSGYERNPHGEEGPLNEQEPTGTDRLVISAREAGIGHDANIYAELGSTWFLILRRPVEAAHVLGKLLKQFGPNRILWGTDSTWYGSPQSLIDAFRAFTIPERMQQEFGYPALTDETKDKILSGNAAALYGIDIAKVAENLVGMSPDWTARAAPALYAALDASRIGKGVPRL